MSDTVLIYTRTAGYRHESIPAAVAAMSGLAGLAGLSAQAGEDPDVFTPERLADCAAVVFLSTTGEVLTDPARAALERYVLDGGGFLGIHSASATEFDWPFYGELIGARFAGHPPVQSAMIHVTDADHPATARMPASRQWVDEWYEFESHPDPRCRVLATVDEDSYAGGAMGAPHPLVWCHEVGLGRSFYTALGHTDEAYSDSAFRDHLLGALAWVTRREVPDAQAVPPVSG